MNILAAYMVPHPPLIVPDVGQGQENRIQDTIDSYQKVVEDIKQMNPETIVIVTPHSIQYSDYIHISPGEHAEGDFAEFRAPQVSFDIEYDKEFADRLTNLSEQNDIAAGFLGEREPKLDHGTMVPLYFLNKAFDGVKQFKFVRIGVSGRSFKEHYKLGQLIQGTAEELGRKTVFIASGDMSHCLKEESPYGYRKEGPEYDKRIMEYVSSGDFLSLISMKEEFCEQARECGQRSFCMMAGVLDGRDVTVNKLSYEGPFGVGYGIVVFHPTGLNEERHFLDKLTSGYKQFRKEKKDKEDIYVQLARKALEEYIRNNRKLSVPADTKEELLNTKAGCFVSLHEEGCLRGCVGTIVSTKDSLAEEIIENAISAAVSDPRFNPVEPNELEYLEYSVDVLGESHKIESLEELDVKRYGVIVYTEYRRGLLLPNLEGIDTVDMQIKIAKQKAGIMENEEVTIERFEVVRHV